MDRARGLSTRARTVWLVGAGGLAALLIAAVGTLAYTNAAKPRLLPVDAAAAAAPPPGSFDMPHNDAPAQIVNEPPRNEAAPPSRDGATTAPARYDAGTAPAPLPPLVTLPRTPLAPAPVPMPAPAPGYAAHAPAPMSPAPLSAPPRTYAATPKPPPQARPAPTPVPRAPVRLAAAKKPKPAATVADHPDAPPIDLDVALISAVVASRHRAEAAACAANTRCPPQP